MQPKESLIDIISECLPSSVGLSEADIIVGTSFSENPEISS
jgi:hypothetical protein